MTTPTGTEARVCEDIARRQALGLAKYGTTVEANPLPLVAWLQHAYEETLDKAIYLRRAIEEMQKKDAQDACRPVQDGRIIVTKDMHVADCNVLLSAHGLDDLPQNMLDAMMAAAPAEPKPCAHHFEYFGDQQLRRCIHCGKQEAVK